MHLLKFDEYLLQIVCKSMKESDFLNPEDWAKYKATNTESLKIVKQIMADIKVGANTDEFTPFPYSTKKELACLASVHSEIYSKLLPKQQYEVNKLLNMKACRCNSEKVQALHSKLSLVNI